MSDLIINGKDALLTWGVRMGTGFLDAFLLPPPNKEPIRNESRLEDGTRIIPNPKKAERELVLPFTVVETEKTMLENFNAFSNELMKGTVTISVPVIDKSRTMEYRNSVTYGMGLSRKICRISVKFLEPKP